MFLNEELVRKAINIPIDGKVGVLDVWGAIGEMIWGEFALSLEFWLAVGALTLVSFGILSARAVRQRQRGNQVRALAGVLVAAGFAWAVVIFGSLLADRTAQVLLAAGYIEAACGAVFTLLAARYAATIDRDLADKSMIFRMFHKSSAIGRKLFWPAPCKIRTPHAYDEKTGTNFAFLNEGKKDGN